MAHNIGQMFYYGDTPWHKLGNKRPAPATIEEALTHGGLNWEVDLIPLQTAESLPQAVSQRMAVVRADRLMGNPQRVLGVVHPGFRPLQNREGALLFDSLLGRGEAIYHTGGHLGNGEVVWLLAKLPAEVCINKQDILEPYLLYTNSHDGSIAIDIRLTMVRVVCQNTLSLALQNTGEKNVFKRAHHGSYDLINAEAKELLNFTLKKTKETEELFKHLAKAECTEPRFTTFLQQLLPDPKQPLTARSNPSVKKAYETRTETIRQMRKSILDVHLNGILANQIPAAESNWWGGLNSITAWVDHVQETPSDRYAHKLFGYGDKLKTAALSKIQEIALRT